MRKTLEVEVIEWRNRPAETPVLVGVTCDRCGADLVVPAAQGVRVIATIGMGMIHDTTPSVPHGMPERMRCPRCGTVYSFEKGVRP